MQPIFSSVRTLCLLGTLTFLGGCTHGKSEDETATLEVARPWHQRVDIDRRYVAQIRAIQHIEVRAFEKGYLQDIFVDEGQQVKKGEKMFQIMPLLMKAEYDKAQAEYEISRIEYDNTARLARKKVVSQNELALAKAKFQKVAAQLDLAKAHLDLTVVKAPFDGIIDRFRVRSGSLVGEGDLLTTFSDISKLWVYFNLSESDYLDYVEQKKKQQGETPVRLMLANGQMYKTPGKIDTIEGEFNNETGNVAVRATFENPDLVLRHGETGNVVLTETIENALVIPQKSTFEILDKRYVYVVDQKGTLEAREISVAQDIPQLFVVRSGITDQDTILLEGIGKVTKGQTIRPKIVAPAEVEKGIALTAE